MTIFSKIIRREVPADILFEDDKCLVFKDIYPKAPTHVLIVPKREITSLAEAAPEDQNLLGHLMLVAADMARKLGIAASGYRVVINTGAQGGQTVHHLHLHLMGGRSMAEGMG
ncbi:MAG TPA: histidine triad nucleotide-binding protein [Bdellovibrionota bacterium]|nr:histidine triad nucleotide-binding protein [Bdellovibrionota bacterium]